LLKIAMNEQQISRHYLQLRVLYAWAMKFSEKYVGPIRQTKQGEGGGLRPGLWGVAPAEKKMGLFWAAASGPI